MTAPAPPDGQSMSVLLFNVLSPPYKRLQSGKEAAYPDLWSKRATALCGLIREINADVVCLQEFWAENSYRALFEGMLSEYSVTFLKRTGRKKDGVATLLRKGMFEVLRREDIKFKMAGQREFALGNIHLTFPHHAFDRALRLRQAQRLTEAVSKAFEGEPNVPILIGGDFNGHEDNVHMHMLKNNYVSCFQLAEGREPGVTHHNHNGEDVSVDRAWLKPAAAVDAPRLVPTRARCLPEELPDSTWPEQFTLSDHRPVLLHFTVESSTPAPSSSSPAADDDVPSVARQHL